MPATTPAWITEGRAALRARANHRFPAGWAFNASRTGGLRLQLRREAGGPVESAYLPFDITRDGLGRALPFVEALAEKLTEGHALKPALAAVTANTTAAAGSWEEIAAAFEIYKKQFENGISESTWKKIYAPVVAKAVERVKRPDAPTSGTQLIQQIVSRWEKGSRRRQQAVDCLCQFLSYAIDQQNLPTCWAPPISRKLLKSVPTKEKRTSKRELIVPTDAELLQIVESFRDAEGELTESRRRWYDAFRLLCLYGLRPVELLHLEPRDRDGELGLWCRYSKRGGATGYTEPRWLEPLGLEGADGSLHTWPDLLMRLRAGDLQMPPITTGNGPADNFRTQLMRIPAWKELRAAYAKQGVSVTAYAPRDAYSRRAHSLPGAKSEEIAIWMGHDLATHLSRYPWSDTRSAAVAAVTAREALAARSNAVA